METIILVPFILAFFVVFLALPVWIRRAHKVGLAGRDMNKNGSEKIAEGGGITVIFGFILGALSYVYIITFYFHSTDYLIKIFSLVISVLIASLVGFVDDIFGWKIGLTKTIRMLFLFFASIPLIVINAGESSMFSMELGLLYPLLIIPLGIIGASTSFNFLAGYNGLEASQGILIIGALAGACFFTGKTWLSTIALIMAVCLFGFYIFNRYPAKIFPGNVMTYATGAMIAITAILGKVEELAIFFFIPYILETILKSRGKLKKESFAKVNLDGSLELPYEKIYGLEHLAIWIIKHLKPNKKAYEPEVVYLINGFQILIIVIGFLLFKQGVL
jgi:UDP-N-acetylglucosamine--dolichyl-phosphate N-acetylglucosaminephosphotransferase